MALSAGLARFKLTTGLSSFALGALVAAGPAPLSFPAPGAKYDLDFANQQYFGATQPAAAGDNTDGRAFAQMVSQAVPTLTEQADGSLLYSAGSGLRITSKGLVVHPLVGFTDILYNRQLGNAAWTKTGCTVTQDLTGRDKRANSASRVTVTAAGATVLQPYTVAGTLKPFVDIKPVSGTGIVDFTSDGGTTWERLSLADVRFDGWARCTLPRRAIALNAQVGLRFPNAGDVVGVDLMHFSDLDYETSPVTTTSARARKPYDRPSVGLVGSGIGGTASGLMEFLRDNAKWGLYSEFSLRNFGFNTFGQIMSIDADGYCFFSTTDRSGAILKTENKALPFPAINRVVAVANGDGSARLCLNGGPVATAASGFGAYTALNHKDLMSNGSGAANGDGIYKRLSILEQLPSDAEMRLWSTLPATGPATAPAQMAAPTLAGGASQIDITRAAAPSDGGSAITGYDLRYSTGGGAWTIVAMGGNPQSVTGLAAGTLYDVQTRAKNAVGDGAWSPSGSATTTAAGPVYDADATALFGRMTVQPDDTRKGIINTYIQDLKASANPWGVMDALHVEAAHDAQAGRLNWKQDLWNLTPVSSPVFTANRGYKFDGANSYAQTGHTPSTAAGKFQQNDAHMALWTFEQGFTNGVMGARTTSGSKQALNIPKNGDALIYRLNADAADVNLTVSTANAMTLVNRKSAAAATAYRDGVLVATGAQPSTGLPTVPILLGALNTAGTPGFFGPMEVAVSSIGGGLTDAQALQFYNATRKYLLAIGAIAA